MGDNMTYKELKDRQQQEVNDFPFIWAFNEKQLAEGMQRLGLDPATDKDKLQNIGAGGIIRKTDAAAMREMFDRTGASYWNRSRPTRPARAL